MVSRFARVIARCSPICSSSAAASIDGRYADHWWKITSPSLALTILRRQAKAAEYSSILRVAACQEFSATGYVASL